MYRQRLRTTTGCLHCKKSKKKCDEKYPKCSFCWRWGFECIRPVPAKRLTAGSLKESNRVQNKPSHQPAPLTTRSTEGSYMLTPLDPALATADRFHTIPIPEECRDVHVISTLQDFFTNVVARALPFDFSGPQQELVHGWLQSMLADAAVCHSFIAYCTRIQMSLKSRPELEYQSLKSETHALSLLQRRLYASAPLAEETLLVAALQFTIYTFHDRKPEDVRRILNGMKSMIESCGGYSEISNQMTFSTLASLAICDTLGSFLTGATPLRRVVKPVKPDHFDTAFADTFNVQCFATRVGASTADLLRDMRIVLLFRSPSRQTRNLTWKESRYLLLQLQYIDNKLGWLQARYLGTGTVTEVTILAMIILKIEIVAEQAQHRFMLEAVLRRLQSAIKIAVPRDGLEQLLLFWACVVALSGLNSEPNRNAFIELASTLTIQEQHQASWTKQDLAGLLGRIAWHVRLRRGLDKIVSTP